MNGAWTYEVDDQWIGWVRFDLPGEKVNKFTAAVMKELDGLLDQVAADQSVKAVVFVSGKPDSFIVGADINELAEISDETDALGKAKAGQRVFDKIAALRVPTVAVVHGACMGGGTELALACDYRLASDDPKTTIALPEVNLGILPGWGGTQRMPRLIGLAQGLTLVMTGKPAVGKKALKLGLVDGLVAKAFLRDQAGAFVGQVLTGKGRRNVGKKRKQAIGRLMRLVQWLPPTRSLIFKKAEKQVLEKTKGHYPAPIKALGVIRETYGSKIDEGLDVEARAFSELAMTEVSRNLVWLFGATQRAKKAGGDGGEVADVRRAAVVGAGVMGGGIAWALSNAGIDVRMKDIAWDAVAKGYASASKMFDAMIKRRKMTKGEMALAMHRISGTVGYEGFGKVDAVIEAVVEDMQIKKKVLAEVETKVPGDALICTNTSSLPVSEMAEALQHPERFVGLHFFNPVNRMPLVEVIAGRKTSEQTIVRAAELAKKLGKTVVVVRDSVGFLVNRVLLPYVNESVRMFEEGAGVQRVDRLIEKFGMPMGPFTLADEVGLDVGLKVARVLEGAFGDRMHVAGVLGEAVETRGVKGKKAGAGFYVWDGKKKSVNDALASLAKTNGHAPPPEGGDRSGLTDEQVVDRAILTMVNEAARCLEEGIVDGAEQVDIAMLMGTGFAPFRGGLLRWADHVGIKEVDERLTRLAEQFGDRFEPAPLIKKLAAEDGTFYQYQPHPECESQAA